MHTSEPSFAAIAPLLAHEAMNIVMAMRSHAAVVPEATVDEMLGSLTALAQRVERLGGHLAEYAKADAFSLARVDPRRVLVDAIEHLAAELGVVVIPRFQDGSLRVLGDEDNLRRALTYLIRHLVMRASPPSSVDVTLCTAADESGEGVAFEVSAPLGDPDQPDVATVFEPLRGRLRGESGLELLIARRIARTHGGDAMARRVGDRLVLTLAVPAARVAG